MEPIINRSVINGNIHEETTTTNTNVVDFVMRDLAVQFNQSKDRDIAALDAYNAALAAEQAIRDEVELKWNWGKEQEGISMPEDFDEDMNPITP